MKVRINYVSNSSSSSYVCVVCGESHEVYDGNSLEDYGMCMCENGHVLCLEHIYKDKKYKASNLISYIRRRFEEGVDYDEPWFMPVLESDKNCEDVREYLDSSELDELEALYTRSKECGFPADVCPICCFDKVDPEDGYRYLLKKNDITEQQLIEELKGFKSYEEFVSKIYK